MAIGRIGCIRIERPDRDHTAINLLDQPRVAHSGEIIDINSVVAGEIRTAAGRGICTTGVQPTRRQGGEVGQSQLAGKGVEHGDLESCISSVSVAVRCGDGKCVITNIPITGNP